MALRCRRQDDSISRFLLGPFIAFYHHYFSRHRRRVPSSAKRGAPSGPLTRQSPSPDSGVYIEMSVPSNVTLTKTPSLSPLAPAGDLTDPDVEAQRGAASLYVEYDDRLLLHIATIISTTLASLLPIISIIVLYFTPNFGARIGVVTVFTLAFTVALRLVSQATTGELFAATSA